MPSLRQSVRPTEYVEVFEPLLWRYCLAKGIGTVQDISGDLIDAPMLCFLQSLV